ncbi:MAG: thioesterase family protein [Bacteroidetes bacterium]|nr:thioesterase family protein [Bacteroidota bacterium]MBS1648685.1 thioesterase family protein [Bacteroidota bacterium]
MKSYLKKVEIRWSDLDPNFHLRHSVYYDWGAFIRMSVFNEIKITPAIMLQHNIGVIIFREECVFKKEIIWGDDITVNLKLLQSEKNFRKWTIQHEVFKNETTLCAIITLDGAWIDIEKRKLTIPPDFFVEELNKIPKADNFIWVEKTKNSE